MQFKLALWSAWRAEKDYPSVLYTALRPDELTKDKLPYFVEKHCKTVFRKNVSIEVSSYNQQTL